MFKASGAFPHKKVKGLAPPNHPEEGLHKPTYRWDLKCYSSQPVWCPSRPLSVIHTWGCTACLCLCWFSPAWTTLRSSFHRQKPAVFINLRLPFYLEDFPYCVFLSLVGYNLLHDEAPISLLLLLLVLLSVICLPHSRVSVSIIMLCA